MTFVVEKLGHLTLFSKQMLNWWFTGNADADDADDADDDDDDDDDDYSLIYPWKLMVWRWLKFLWKSSQNSGSMFIFQRGVDDDD